jgi:hypothetical protein
MPSTSPFQAEARIRLNAFFAGINQLSAEARAPAVREYLERGLERLQAIEQQHYAFLAECALLAADNVQDVRLFDLERRVQALENPDSDWGELLLGVALNVALQVAVLVALEAAAALAIALIGRSGAAKVMRDAAASYDPVTLLTETRTSYQQSISKRRWAESADHKLDRIAYDLAQGTVEPGGFKIDIAPAGKSPLTVQNMADWTSAKAQVAALRDALNAEVQIGRRAMAQNNSRAQGAYAYTLSLADAAGDDAINAWSKDWRDFIGGERGGLLLTPAYTLFDKVRADLAKVDIQAQRPRLPISSEIAGRLLAWASQKQLEVADDYAAWRLHVRYSSDADLKQDTRCAALAQLVTEALPRLEVQRGLNQAARSVIVTGFEAAYWLEILRANGYLEVVPNTAVTHAGWHLPGDIVDGRVLTKKTADLKGRDGSPRGTQWQADLYVGVGLMTEVQATYLFHRYAKAWYAVPANVTAAKLPFVYEEANYASLVAEQPKLWEGLLWSTEHTLRLNQMKLMVVLYFIALLKGDVSSVLDDVFGPGMAAEVHAYLGELPQGAVPSPTDSAAAELNALDASREPLQSLYSAVGIAPLTEFKLAALDFADQLALLEQDIQTYQLLQAGAAEQLGTGVYASADDLLQSFDSRRSDLDAAFIDLRTMSEEDPAAARWLHDTFDARLQALDDWQSPQGWQFYPEPAITSQ